MARGWESKSIELQQSEAAEREVKTTPRLTPEEAVRERERQGLLLSRTRILQQVELAQNPLHQKMLRDAIAELEARLAKLDHKTQPA
jgi:hypothetical protein